MKKLLFFQLAIYLLLAFKPVPQGVKPVDVAEWNQYVDYCNEFVPVNIYQWSKFRIKQNNVGEWTNSKGEYVIDTTYKAFWYRPIIPTYSEPFYKTYSQDAPNCELNEHAIATVHQIYIRRRRHTVTDFYKLWLTDSIKH